MIHLTRILFPTDGSDCAERARKHAVHLARRYDAELHVVQVEERDVELNDVVEVTEDDVSDDLHLPPREMRVAEPQVRERRVVHRSAAGGILSYTAEHDISLIVLGSHGRRGVRRLVLGSVAEEVLRRAPCPVMTVGRGASPPAAIDGGRLLVPIDLSAFQDQLLAHARELALAYGLSVTLLHVITVEGVPDVYGLRTEGAEPDARTDRVREAVEEQAAPLREAGLEVAVDVRSGHVSTTILDTVDDVGADMLAIATHGRTGVERMLMGSVAETVLRRASCPVFTVRSFGTSLVRESSGA